MSRLGNSSGRVKWEETRRDMSNKDAPFGMSWQSGWLLTGTSASRRVISSDANDSTESYHSNAGIAR